MNDNIDDIILSDVDAWTTDQADCYSQRDIARILAALALARSNLATCEFERGYDHALICVAEACGLKVRLGEPT